MAKKAKEFSVAELERLLTGKKTELENLLKKREQLAKEMASVVDQIRDVQGPSGTAIPASDALMLNGSVPDAAPAAPKRGRPAVRRKGALRPQNDRSLREVVTELLTTNRKGMGLHELSESVLATGYKTNSTNFKNTLYQCLYNADNITLDKKNGLYHIV